MSKKSKVNPKPNPEPERHGKYLATLTFELPEAEEFLELAVQARKWRQLVHDLTLALMSWRDTARTPQEASAYRSVNLVLRDRLADAGLTIYTWEQQENFHRQKVEDYAKHLDALLEKGNAAWRDLMKTEIQHPDDLPKGKKTETN